MSGLSTGTLNGVLPDQFSQAVGVSYTPHVQRCQLKVSGTIDSHYKPTDTDDAGDYKQGSMAVDCDTFAIGVQEEITTAPTRADDRTLYDANRTIVSFTFKERSLWDMPTDITVSLHDVNSDTSASTLNKMVKQAHSAKGFTESNRREKTSDSRQGLQLSTYTQVPLAGPLDGTFQFEVGTEERSFASGVTLEQDINTGFIGIYSADCHVTQRAYFYDSSQGDDYQNQRYTETTYGCTLEADIGIGTISTGYDDTLGKKVSEYSASFAVKF